MLLFAVTLSSVVIAACGEGSLAETAVLGTRVAQSPTPTAIGTATAIDMPSPSPTPTVVPSPTAVAEASLNPGVDSCPTAPDPDWWVPEPTTVMGSGEPYKPPALEQLLYYSDTVVHASLASVTTRTESAPLEDSWFDEEQVPPGKTPAPVCKATFELRFEVDEYLIGTGPAEVLVEIPLRAYSVEGHLVRNFHLRQETEANAASWWDARSPLWDSRKAVLFLKLGEDDGKALSFTEVSDLWGISYEGPEEYAWSWLPEVDDDFVPPPATHGQRRLPDKNSHASLSGDGSAPRFLSASGKSGRGPTPGIMSLSDLRSRIAEFEAVVEKGRGVPGYTQCIETVLWYERDARYEGEPHFPYQAESSLPSGLPAGTVVDWSDLSPHWDVIDYHGTWLEGSDRGLFEVTLKDDDSSANNGYSESLSAVRPLPFGKYEIERYYVPYTDTLCPDFTPNGFSLLRFGQWTISVEASVEGTLHEAFFDPDLLANAVGVSEEGGLLQPGAFTVNGATATIHGLKWRAGSVSMRLESYGSLGGYDVDIVDLDGSARLTLPVAEATVDPVGQTLTWRVPNRPWRWGDKLMLRIRPEGDVPPKPGPRPWVPEVLDLTARAGTESSDGSLVPAVTLEWRWSDSVDLGSRAGREVQLWDGSAQEWREPPEASAGIRHTGDDGRWQPPAVSTFWPVDPGPYTFRVRYKKYKRFGEAWVDDFYSSEWKYVSVVVPGAQSDPNASPTPAAPVPAGSP